MDGWPAVGGVQVHSGESSSATGPRRWLLLRHSTLPEHFHLCDLTRALMLCARTTRSRGSLVPSSSSMRRCTVWMLLSCLGSSLGFLRPTAQPRAVRMHAETLLDPREGGTSTLTYKQPLSFRVADKVVGAMFSIDPVFDFLSSNARNMMIKRADTIGVSWHGIVDEFKRNMESLQQEYEGLNRDNLVIPEYYRRPFHAYREGNLCWEAAMEVEPAAYTVHAPIYTESQKVLEREGDDKLRGSFHARMREMLVENNFKPSTILDVGCSTGLSTIRLHQSFPEAQVLGIDLSPYMLAVSKYNLRTRPELAQAVGSVDYAHAAGEDTGLPDNYVDMVSICLVHHELPQQASRAMFKEAYRLLKPGGALSFMDMDPTSKGFQGLVRNPMLFALFKSTEPWLGEYAALDLEGELREAGFGRMQVRPNSPRHRTVVAFAEK